MTCEMGLQALSVRILSSEIWRRHNSRPCTGTVDRQMTCAVVKQSERVVGPKNSYPLKS